MTRDKRGAYTWTGTVDAAFDDQAFRIALGVCGGVCLFFVIMSLILGGGMLWIVLLTSAAALAVVGGICLLFKRRAGQRGQRYIMDEHAVYFCQGRANIPFSFKSIRKAVVCPSRNMIGLYQAVGSSPVFTSAEDFAFVRDYILQRLPAGAEIEHESGPKDTR